MALADGIGGEQKQRKHQNPNTRGNLIKGLGVIPDNPVFLFVDVRGGFTYRGCSVNIE